jgi:LysM repeat protein
MKSPKKWFYVGLFLIIASLVLVACERPLPGGYNDPEAGEDTTVPEVPQVIPEVDSSYPAESEAPAPVDAAPVDAEAYPAEEMQADEAYPADGTGELAAEEVPEAQEEPAAEAEAAPEDAAVAEDAAATEDAEVQEGEEATVELPGTHTVAAGENLYRIGLLYGVSWLDLAAANNIDDPANLTVGQVLVIPGPDDTVEEAVAEEATESAASEEVTESEAAEEPAAADSETDVAAEEETAERPETYVVQTGDNLYRIGLNLGVDWNEIVAANGIVNNQIVPGQVLIIPYPDSAEAEDAEPAVDSESTEETEAEQADDTPAEEAGETYVVQEGDSIYKVAFIHDIPWTLLVEANNIEAPYTLEVGQELIIPAVE